MPNFPLTIAAELREDADRVERRAAVLAQSPSAAARHIYADIVHSAEKLRRAADDITYLAPGASAGG